MVNHFTEERLGKFRTLGARSQSFWPQQWNENQRLLLQQFDIGLRKTISDNIVCAFNMSDVAGELWNITEVQK
ncbi:hypothetical protein ACTXT7_016798 [Hymenolepis weldensis]